MAGFASLLGVEESDLCAPPREWAAPSFRSQEGAPPVEWRKAPALIAYPDAMAEMEAHVAALIQGAAPERVWLLEHPPLYTAGTSAAPEELLSAERFPVYASGRGGRYTYHGPGQRIAYVMLDLKRRTADVRAFVAALEAWIIMTLGTFGVEGLRREGRVGVWVRRPDKGAGVEDKIAAIGVRVRRFVTFHGISLNVAPELEHFSGIVPCGITGHGVTSLADLGLGVTMADVDAALCRSFETIFGAVKAG